MPTNGKHLNDRDVHRCCKDGTELKDHVVSILSATSVRMQDNFTVFLLVETSINCMLQESTHAVGSSLGHSFHMEERVGGVYSMYMDVAKIQPKWAAVKLIRDW